MIRLLMGDAEEQEPEPKSRLRRWSSGVRVWGSAIVVDPGIYPLIAGTVALFLVMFLQPDRGTKDLYVVAAQIIPVLLLALALEARVFSSRNELPPPPSDPGAVLREVQGTIARLERMQNRLATQRERLDAVGAELTLLEQDFQKVTGATEEELAGVRTVLVKHREDHAAAQAAFREREQDIEEMAVLLEDQEKRVKAIRRWWWLRKGSWWGIRMYYVGVGIGVLAVGEFEALFRIADGGYNERPDFALAAIGYGFAAALVASLSKPSH